MKYTEIGASVKREIDVGYVPYMRYLASLNGRGPAFGTREQSKAEVTLWAKVQIDEGDDVAKATSKLIERLDDAVLEQLKRMFPAVFEQAAQTPADDFTYVEVKTKINPEGGPDDW